MITSNKNNTAHKSLRDFSSMEERRSYIEQEKNVKFAAIGSIVAQIETASAKNCENMIGSAQIPLGIAGPLHIKNDDLDESFYIPLATTEGALIASVSRGCKAITAVGGAQTRVESVGITRGAVFQTSGIVQNKKAETWIRNHKEEIRTKALQTSSHITFLDAECSSFGTNLFVRFSYDTQDAMGMNMVTIATDVIVKWLKRELSISCVSLAGNFDIDKKPAWLNFLKGRGKKVWAQVVLSSSVLHDVLKTDATKMHEVNLRKNIYGSIASGSMGFNAHYANVLAALFLATGQDPAHVVEGSLGVTTTEIIDGQLYISVFLPDLIAGTIGGGMSLPTQKESLQLLGVFGANEGKNAVKFAHIVAAAVLAGEISLLASLSQGTLAAAHQKLARGRK
jgi:hydroxymethylglutaryl-CoA reductase (NADPH)